MRILRFLTNFSIEDPYQIALRENLVMIMSHILLFFFFLIFKIPVLLYYDLFSIFFYVLMQPLIQAKKCLIYEILAYLEVLVFMTLCSLYLGNRAGFVYFTMILMPLTFLLNYAFKHVNTPSVHPAIVSCGLLVVALSVTSYMEVHDPIIEEKPQTLILMYSLNIIFAFVCVAYYMIIFLYMTKRYEKILSDRAETDNLTRIGNRYFLDSKIHDIFENEDKHGSWIAMLDIDDFKKFNDTYGHDCGDYVLRRVSYIIKETCSGCTYGRWGGEEFLIIGKEPAHDPKSVMEALRTNIAKEDFLYERQNMHVTVTIGAARYTEGDTVDSWIRLADSKNYEGKNLGKNRVIL
jgi:diguanylate cyclase (GGDEF)-like protein